jgi:hypothetical protein
MPLAIPFPAVPRPRDAVYGTGRVDASGRVAERAVTVALGWRGGDRLTITASEGVVVARRDPLGMVILPARACLVIPSASTSSTPCSPGPGIPLETDTRTPGAANARKSRNDPTSERSEIDKSTECDDSPATEPPKRTLPANPSIQENVSHTAVDSNEELRMESADLPRRSTRASALHNGRSMRHFHLDCN